MALFGEQLDRQGLVRKLAAVPDAFTGKGTMSSRQPGYTEGVIDWLSRNVFGDDRAGREKAEWLTGGVLSTPGISELGDAYSVGQDLGQGNYLRAGLGLAMAGLPGPSPKKIKAFHSSPHDFERFDINKVGTGQGAQSYGHGIYVAESPAVSGKGGEYYQEFSRKFPEETPEGKAFDYLKTAGHDRAKALALAEDNVAYHKANLHKDKGYKTPRMANWHAEHYKEAEAARDLLASDQIIGPRTYEVEINADPESFLDWDRPLNQQKEEVQAQLQSAMGAAKWEQLKHADVATAVRNGFIATDPKVATTNKLREAGIPGIRYLDQGSRTAFTSRTQAQIEGELKVLRSDLANVEAKGIGDPERIRQRIASAENELGHFKNQTRNYVLFDDKLISILKKYGLIGLLGGGAAAATQSPEASANPLDNQGLVRRLNRGRE